MKFAKMLLAAVGFFRRSRISRTRKQPAVRPAKHPTGTEASSNPISPSIHSLAERTTISTSTRKARAKASQPFAKSSGREAADSRRSALADWIGR